MGVHHANEKILQEMRMQMNVECCFERQIPMKYTTLPSTRNCSTKRISGGFIIAAAVILLQNEAGAVPTVDLGDSSGFAVLAGSGITVAGAVNTTTITGDIGTYPTESITGLGNVVLNGVNQTGNAVTQNAKTDLTIAYDDAAGRTYDVLYTGGFDLVGLTLTPGVYKDASSLFLSGTLTLDAQNNPDAVWIFQAGSTLITASDSSVALIRGGQACNVFWQVGSSATLGTGTDFQGTILAQTSITLNTDATVYGRLLAQNGAVTLDNNTITSCVPEPGGTLLLAGSGLVVWFAVRKRLARAA